MTASFPVRDHPRIRGEHQPHISTLPREMGSSPHSRGTLNRKYSDNFCFGIIPAFAGNTVPLRVFASIVEDHPRIRGEHNEGVKWTPQEQWIIPAFAGNTSLNLISITGLWDHPRIRGEHCSRMAATFFKRGSSPHSRGTPHGQSRLALRIWIIPAFAGNTACDSCP